MDEDGYPPRSDAGCFWWAAVGAIGIVLLGFLVLTWAVTARAHEATNTAGQPLGWVYPWSCCSQMDCRPVSSPPNGDVEERPEGYVIRSTGEVIPYADKRVKDSPDGTFHVCAHQAGIDAGHVICLFVPPRGF